MVKRNKRHCSGVEFLSDSPRSPWGWQRVRHRVTSTRISPRHRNVNGESRQRVLDFGWYVDGETITDWSVVGTKITVTVPDDAIEILIPESLGIRAEASSPWKWRARFSPESSSSSAQIHDRRYQPPEWNFSNREINNARRLFAPRARPSTARAWVEEIHHQSRALEHSLLLFLTAPTPQHMVDECSIHLLTFSRGDDKKVRLWGCIELHGSKPSKHKLEGQINLLAIKYLLAGPGTWVPRRR